eukprot:jgi/Botrbrau1/4420/Bobra.0348s0010.1
MGNAEKRKADEEPSGPSKKAAKIATKVHPNRVRSLNANKIKDGPVIYWMSRDQRVNDNWALLYACEVAAKSGSNVAVAFNLVPAYLHAGARQFGFMLRGLRQVEAKLQALNIPFFLLKGDPVETLPGLAKDLKAGLLVADFGPLRLGREWRDKIAAAVHPIACHEVDAHNIVPCWIASDKREYGARTIRRKINDKLPEYLQEYPPVPKQAPWSPERQPDPVDWEALLQDVLTRGAEVPEVAWCTPGEDAALQACTGPKGFLSPARLASYDAKRNDPTQDALSNLSPYLHFGQLAAARAAMEAAKHKSKYRAAVESYLEELIVRRELADNFCFYTPNYDSLDCCADWARQTLHAHRNDKREHIYTREQFEKGMTHDELWNAAQLEMVHSGKMHGFMRMYWAKKILEWTNSPEEALEIAIWLNDKWELDGREPSGYVGCIWSIGGIHDQGWAERPIFGKIRYMNYAGCKRKFNVDAYVQKIRHMMKQVKAKKATGQPVASSAAQDLEFSSKVVDLWEAVNETLQALEAVGGQNKEAVEAVVKGLVTLQKAAGVSAEVLASTGIGKKVKELSKHAVPDVAAAAKKVVEVWKKAVLKKGSS